MTKGDGVTLRQPTDLDRYRARRCTTCNGVVWVKGRPVRRRHTVAMVCPACGWDYYGNGEPTA